MPEGGGVRAGNTKPGAETGWKLQRFPYPGTHAGRVGSSCVVCYWQMTRAR